MDVFWSVTLHYLFLDLLKYSYDFIIVIIIIHFNIFFINSIDKIHGIWWKTLKYIFLKTCFLNIGKIGTLKCIQDIIKMLEIWHVFFHECQWYLSLTHYQKYKWVWGWINSYEPFVWESTYINFQLYSQKQTVLPCLALPCLDTPIIIVTLHGIFESLMWNFS